MAMRRVKIIFLALVGSVAGLFWGAGLFTAFSELTFHPGVPESNLVGVVPASWILAGGITGVIGAFEDLKDAAAGKIRIRLGWLLFAVSFVPTILFSGFAISEHNEGLWMVIPYYAAPLAWGLINILRGRELVRTLAETPPVTIK